MGNVGISGFPETTSLQVCAIRRRSFLVKGEPLHPDSATAQWMKSHHGDLSIRSSLPWRSAQDYRAPLVVAVWCIPPYVTGDDVGATVYATQRGTNLVAYVVDSTGATYDINVVLSGIHADTSIWWRHGSFGTTVSNYIDSLEYVESVDHRLSAQLASDYTQVVLRSKKEIGCFLPEHTLGLCVSVLLRPLHAECLPQSARRQWTTFIQQLQGLMCVFHLMKPDTLCNLSKSIYTLVAVNVERLLVTPASMVPTNAPAIILDTLAQMTPLIGPTLERSYGGLLLGFAAASHGCNVVVLDGGKYRPKPFQLADTSLIQWLITHRPEIGVPLQQLIQGSAASSELQRIGEDLLKHLALVAVPQDRQHRWVDDAPWDRIIEMALESYSFEQSATIKSHVRHLNQMLGTNLQHS